MTNRTLRTLVGSVVMPGTISVHFEREPHLVAKLPDREVWMAFFRDPDGYLVELLQRHPS